MRPRSWQAIKSSSIARTRSRSAFACRSTIPMRASRWRSTKGWAVVGVTTRESVPRDNLYLIDPDKKKPVWTRAANKEVEKAPAPEKGQYGTPTLPDGTRSELPQRDEKVWAPLSVAIHSAGAKKLIAVADYQGWQRWVRSSATRQEENQGLRFMPTKPTITVYDEANKVVRRSDAS